ncbi:hypothetical protein BCR36DRAFT_416954 [Piromyces finnis]|uniref:KN homeodomain domain-containing protein n=1 Tax=Piromyces finnis TaxID=1754191 RepID=A0A1Y1US60_9FUNG|nr:hypothetical protein BCR36DRAFT_416954 [Piromyces finnis]|eukprot:ORX40344.1 hypothetical protein BCR36DRAFT_416954 [Piromyces finnis]
MSSETPKSFCASSPFPLSFSAVNNRKYFMEIRSPLPSQSNSINPFITKESFTNPFDNFLDSPTCSPVFKRNSILLNELFSNPEINYNNEISSSPIVLPTTRINENLFKKNEENQFKYISPKMLENNKNLEKKKNGKFKSMTEFDKLSTENNKISKQFLNKKDSLEGKKKRKKNDLIHNINQKSKQCNNSVNINKIKKNLIGKILTFFKFNNHAYPFLIKNYSPILNNVPSTSVPLINTPLLSSPYSSCSPFLFDNVSSSSDSIVSEFYSNFPLNPNPNPNSYPNLNSNSSSNSNSNSNSCEKSIISVDSLCSNSVSNVDKHKRKCGNSKGRKRPNYSHKVTKILKEWLSNHSFPYPTITEKNRLCEATGLTLLNNWFVNARRRYS